MIARRAEAGDPDMHYAKITEVDAVKAGILTDDEVADAKRQLPDAVFRDLYMADPSDVGGNQFGIDATARCIEVVHSDWERQEWGWYLAKWVDWTWGIAICGHGGVCRSVRFQRPWTETIE